MKSKLINDGPQKTYVLVLDKGDEAVGCIEGFARENRIAAAQLTGARIREYVGADHDIHAQHPAELAADLLDLATRAGA